MCDVFDLDDCCSVFINTPVTAARKEHRCTSCSALIAKGDSYVRHFNVYEGSATTEKVCAVCMAVYEEFVEEHHGAYSPGSLADSLDACIDGGDYTFIDGDRVWDERTLYWMQKREELTARRRAA